MATTFTATVVVGAAPALSPRVILAQGAATYTFDSATGVSQGDYNDPNGAFTQRSILCTNPSLPYFRAYYRPDVTGGREEWVFELGDAFAAAGVPVNMAAYDVQIIPATGSSVYISVPAHYWFARWRWQSAPRPVRTTAAALVAAKLVPHYDGSVLGRFNTNNAVKTYTPMTFAGLVAGMGFTGERGDIGIMTDWQANWICNGDPGSLSTALAQGEASGTIQMFIRDPATGGPLDIVNKFPQATMYDPSVGTPFIRHTTGLVDYDDGHDPALAYLPALLTGDPYFIEALQFQSLFEVMGGPPTSRYTKNGRYWAWPLRNKAYAATCTPASVPSWMLPKSVFRTMMESQRQSMVAIMASSAPQYAVFHCQHWGGTQGNAPHPAETQTACWQDEFVAGVLGMCVQLGFTEWRPQLVWKLDSDVNRLNGTFWPRASPVPYIMALRYTCNLVTSMTASQTTMTVDQYGTAPWPATPFTITLQSPGGSIETITVTDKTTPTWTVTRDPNPAKRVPQPAPNAVVGPFFTSWQQCASRTITQMADEFPFMPGDPTGMNQIYNANPGSVVYVAYCRGALAIAIRNGVTENGIQAAYDWINGQFATYVRSAWHPDWRWCIT